MDFTTCISCQLLVSTSVLTILYFVLGVLTHTLGNRIHVDKEVI